MRNLTRESATVLSPAMPAEPPGGAPGPGSRWVGAFDGRRQPRDGVVLRDSKGFSTARLLVRNGRNPRGFVELPIRNGTIEGGELRAATARLPLYVRPTARPSSPPISVVVCTRDRPHQLRAALASVLGLDYPYFEVIVVDNGPASRLTPPVVRAIGDPRVRVVDAPVQGLARARNAGLVAARHGIVAFTDDDVVVDRWWLQGIADGFSAASQVACVCGMVASGELTSTAQAYFDRRVQWARSCRSEVFSLNEPRPSEPLFPFQVGRFGTGANFAVRRDVVLELRGFDEALGIGSPTGGGEDIDMFVRVLLAGHQLVYDPAALVWHRHRADIESLSRQIRDYGTGLGAWFAKLAGHPATARMMVRRLRPGLRHLRRITTVDITLDAADGRPSPDLTSLARRERLAILQGPLALARARRRGARAQPLAPASTSPGLPRCDSTASTQAHSADSVEAAL